MAEQSVEPTVEQTVSESMHLSTSVSPSDVFTPVSELFIVSSESTESLSETVPAEPSATVPAAPEHEITTVRSTEAVTTSTTAAETKTTRQYQLKLPERVSQAPKRPAEATVSTSAPSTNPTTASTTTSTTLATYAAPSQGYSGGSVARVSSVTPSVPAVTKQSSPVCTLTISCKDISQNPDLLKREEKLPFVPEDGYILKNAEMSFTQGETVYDVLLRACDTHTCDANCAFCSRDGKIQIESTYTPVYKSYYVEGIHQLYEKDCGGTSGWTYYVNGSFPHYGSSQYTLHDGDRIEWVYSIEKDGLE